MNSNSSFNWRDIMNTYNFGYINIIKLFNLKVNFKIYLIYNLCLINLFTLINIYFLSKIFPKNLAINIVILIQIISFDLLKPLINIISLFQLIILLNIYNSKRIKEILQFTLLLLISNTFVNNNFTIITFSLILLSLYKIKFIIPLIPNFLAILMYKDWLSFSSFYSLEFIKIPYFVNDNYFGNSSFFIFNIFLNEFRQSEQLYDNNEINLLFLLSNGFLIFLAFLPIIMTNNQIFKYLKQLKFLYILSIFFITYILIYLSMINISENQHFAFRNLNLVLLIFTMIILINLFAIIDQVINKTLKVKLEILILIYTIFLLITSLNLLSTYAPKAGTDDYFRQMIVEELDLRKQSLVAPSF